MSATMAVRSGELRKTFGIDHVYLHRWQQRGLIAPLLPATGYRAGGAVWPDWTWRMVALLRLETSIGGAQARARTDLLREVAEVLAMYPDTPFVVFREGRPAMPAWDAGQVVALHRHAVCSTVVAIPSLEEARAS